jgi:adenylate cyclase
MYGELIPLGGGDPIPLMKKSLMVGRRESCDIVLRFPNVSSHHCQLTLDSGYWYVKDLNSRNGLKVDEVRVTEKRLDPGCTLSKSSDERPERDDEPKEYRPDVMDSFRNRDLKRPKRPF